MYQARLISGVPLQILPKGDIERSKKGSLYLQMGNPIEITDDEAEYIRKQMEDPKTGLGNFRIVLERIGPEKAGTQQVETKEPITATPTEPEAVSEPEPEPDDEAEPELDATMDEPGEPEKPKGRSKRRRKG